MILERPGDSDYARTLKRMFPDTWASVFCPSGEWHIWRKRPFRRTVCKVCEHKRGW